MRDAATRRTNLADEPVLADRAVLTPTGRAWPGEGGPFLLVTADAAQSSGRRAAGARVQGFATEREARAAFIAARLSSGPGPEWAELVARHPNGRVRTLAWFGPELVKPEARATAAVADAVTPSESGRRRLVDRLRHRLG